MQTISYIFTFRYFNSHLSSKPHIVSITMKGDSRIGLLPVETVAKPQVEVRVKEDVDMRVRFS